MNLYVLKLPALVELRPLLPSERGYGMRGNGALNENAPHQSLFAGALSKDDEEASYTCPIRHGMGDLGRKNVAYSAVLILMKTIETYISPFIPVKTDLRFSLPLTLYILGALDVNNGIFCNKISLGWFFPSLQFCVLPHGFFFH